ncbi:hypothetical protein BRARA_A00840 [Brassica rapa]|uniref:BHLH domain-containing protein n=1 Tax=Brassica campestris TaxID=3711 RepID=A0A398AMJ2_BRACM|nr:hypothetical protein BRARA_A00840 [Brassica rapa]
MGEDDIVELLWKSGHLVRSSQAQRPSVPPPPPPVLRGSESGSGGGGGEESAPLPPPPPPLYTLQQPSDQNLFIREDETASWLYHHPPREEDEFSSQLFYSGLVTTPFTQPQGSVSLTTATTVTTTASSSSRDLTQVGSSVTPLSSATTESCLTPAMVTGGVAQTFAVPRAVETVCEIAGPSSFVVSKVETEQVQTEERKRKEREEPVDDTEETGEEARGSTSRKRSRAAEMHNISERRRREKINEKMKALQELIPRCNKTDKASMLEDAIQYVKSLQMQIQVILSHYPLCLFLCSLQMNQSSSQLSFSQASSSKEPEDQDNKPKG